MSVTVEISNPANLIRVRSLTGAKTDGDAVELVLEEYLKHHEPTVEAPEDDLPQEYWDDLFSDRMLPDNAGSQAIVDERNEARY